MTMQKLPPNIQEKYVKMFLYLKQLSYEQKGNRRKMHESLASVIGVNVTICLY